MAITDTNAGFDTLAVARTLKAAGVEEKQSEAHAEVARKARAGPAAKADLDNLESRMQATLYRALWMQTGAIVGTIVAMAGVVVAALEFL